MRSWARSESSIPEGWRLGSHFAADRYEMDGRIGFTRKLIPLAEEGMCWDFWVESIR